MSESILQKIQKLLAKAASTDNIHERDTFILGAQKLLQEYNLDMSQVEGLKGYEDIREETTTFQDVWESQLLYNIATHNFCTTIRFTGTDKQNVIGKPSNIAVVVYLYKFYHYTLLELGMKSYMDMCKERLDGIEPSKSLKSKYLLDYMLGGVNGINQKMREQKEEFKKGGGSELMIINDKKVQDYFDEKYPKSRKGRGVQINTKSSGYCNGYRDGKNINSYNAVTSGAKQIK